MLSECGLLPDLMTPSTSREKIEAYEELLEGTLKVRLQEVHDDREKLHARIAQVLELQNSVRMLRDQDNSTMKTMVNLGCDFYVQAHVPDTSWLYVDVGLGFHAQMTLEEVDQFCTQRESALTASSESLRERSVQLKTRIKLVMGAIDEISKNEQGAHVHAP